MENIKRPGFIASVVNMLWDFIKSFAFALITTGALVLFFALFVGGIYNLFMAQPLGWSHVDVWFVWAALMNTYLLIQLVGAWLRKGK